ncbi:MAG: hypothetical protein J6C46_11150 [Clostridia bacterium]|nr:hypothetical protein [Clostridia bacterium]
MKMQIIATMPDKQLQLPLIQRLKLGANFCSQREIEAAGWLMNWLHRPASGGGTLGENMLYQAKFSGQCWVTVPYSKQNPERPWIVNTILQELGAKLLEYREQEAYAGMERVSSSIEFTYDTKFMGTLNEGW